MASIKCHVDGFLLGHDVLVWSPESVQYLRHEWRIVGGLVGALPNKPRQNNQLGLPLLLLPEEVALLLNKDITSGILEVHESNPIKCQDKLSAQHSTEQSLSLMTERSNDQILRDHVFRDLWEKGYYMTSGLKYGGDFLVYADDPSSSHSSYIALVLSQTQHITCLPALARVATKVKKKILLCSADDCYCTLEWAGI